MSGIAMKKLQYYRLLFGVSALSVTVSMIVVLALTYYLVVPYRLATELVLTTCTVVALTPEGNANRSCIDPVTGVGKIVPGSINSGEEWMCLQVTVSYRITSLNDEETYHYGTLSNVASSGSLNDEILFAKFKANRTNGNQDCCSGCIAPLQKQTSHFTNCSLVLSHRRASIPLFLNKELHCFYQRSLPGVLIKDHKVMVNIVLWPTLIFVVGFVGMFMSYIKMQQETMIEQKKRRRDAHRCILEESPTSV